MLLRILLTCLIGTLAGTDALAANVNVAVGGGSNVYTPANFTINVGDTVTFTNTGGFHNVQSGAGSKTTFRCANGCDGAGGNGNPSSEAWVSVVTFTNQGAVPYLCQVHGQAMSGTITVVPVPVRLQSFDID